MSDLAALNRVVSLSSAANDFLVYAKALLLGNGTMSQALEAVEHRHVLGGPRVTEILKSAIVAGTTADATWAESLAPYRAVSNGFIASLAKFSAFDAILNDGGFLRVPMKTRLAVTTIAASNGTAGESKTKLVSRLSLSAPTLEPRKSSCVIVISEELAKSLSTAATQLLGEELRRGVARATDADFLNSITTDANVENITATGSYLSAFLADLNVALAVLEMGSTSRLYLIAPPRIVKAIALMRGRAGAPAFPSLTISGGYISGITVTPSDALTDSIVILDAQQVAADASVVVLDNSRQSSLQMDDAPTDGATNTMNLWQSNLVGLRAERWWGAELLRANGAVVISDADYGGTGTGT